jgi:transposase
MKRWAMAEARPKSMRTPSRARCGWFREPGKPIAQAARQLGINEGTLGNRYAQDRRRHGEGALAENEREQRRRRQFRGEPDGPLVRDDVPCR